MDTTKINIQMCKKAKEIQKEWKPEIGDNIYIEGWNMDVTIIIGDDFVRLKSHIWFPRQDQLQEMIKELFTIPMIKKNPYEIMLDEFYEFTKAKETIPEGIKVPKYLYNVTSMEQLWLAFVMKEKYNKI